MAYDPEAREQSNAAMIIGVVALVLMVVGALAYYSTQNTRAEIVATPPSVIHTERTEVVPVPQNPPAPVVVEREKPVIVPGPPTTKVIERDTHTTVTRDRVVPAPPAATAPRSSTNTQVTVNVPPAPRADTKRESTRETTRTPDGTETTTETETTSP